MKSKNKNKEKEKKNVGISLYLYIYMFTYMKALLFFQWYFTLPRYLGCFLYKTHRYYLAISPQPLGAPPPSSRGLQEGSPHPPSRPASQRPPHDISRSRP